MRPLFLYANPVDFGQPAAVPAQGAVGATVADPCIGRYLEIGGQSVKRHNRYDRLIEEVRRSSAGGGQPTVLFCIGVSEKRIQERLSRLVSAGATKLLVYLAGGADNDAVRREVFEARALCCWDARAFPKTDDLTRLCRTDYPPYKLWKESVSYKVIFVACSYDSKRRLRFEYWLRKGLELCGLDVHYASDRATPRGALSVNQQTISQIKSCDLMVAILDEPYNCNAVYEIGIADAHKKPAIIFKEHGKSLLPIDIRERVFDEFRNAEELGYRLHHGLR